MARCLISLGSNLGDRNAALSAAVSHLQQDARLRLLAKSNCRETKAAGGPPGQIDFLNATVLAETELAPLDVLDSLAAVEAKMGRVRKSRWGPRIIDLDLLLYDEEKVQSERLSLPHPRMAWRRFVLEPAAEIAPTMIHPGTGWTIARLLQHLDSAHNYVAVAGSIGAGKTWLARRVAAQTSARMIAEELDYDLLQRFYGDPAGTAAQMELEFLRQRTRLLAADQQQWSDRSRLAVSDFWFDQSVVFAGIWLGKEDFDGFFKRWKAARRRVVQPKLTVVLSEPPQQAEAGGWLLQRVRHRGRAYENRLSGELLHRIELALLRRVEGPEVGPVLRLAASDPQAAVAELSAAMAAMQ